MTALNYTTPRSANARGPTRCVLVLLAGGAAPSPLVQALGCSLLDVEVAPEVTLLKWWCSRDWGTGPAERAVRTVRGIGSPRIASLGLPSPLPFDELVDQGGPRGSAGALRDAATGEASGTLMIVAESSSLVTAPLDRLLAEHAASGADVSLVATATGRPTGMAFLTSDLLALVRPRGFVDFKEQFLPAVVAAGKRTRVISVDEASVHPIHDRRGLLAAVSALDRLSHGDFSETRPTDALRARPGVSLVSEGARVAADAIVHGSVVMAGATIEPGVVVARCVVTRGSTVRAGTTVLDRIITPSKLLHDEQLPHEGRRGHA